MPRPDSSAARTRPISSTGARAMLHSDISTKKMGSVPHSHSAGHSAASAPDSRGSRCSSVLPVSCASRSELRKCSPTATRPITYSASSARSGSR